MLHTLLAAALVLYLPGALLYRLPVWQRSTRAGLAAEERVFWALIISAAWSTSVVLALASIDAYSFSRLLTVNTVVSGLMIAVGRGRLRYRGEARPPHWSSAMPVLFIALGWFLIAPPFEYVMGGKDPGVYMNEGIQIAQRGTLVTRDPVIATVPGALSDLFYRQSSSDAYYGVRFMGFFIKDPAAGTVVGQFPHGFPASVAIGYGLHGLTGARFAVGVWAVLAWIAIYLFAVQIVGRVAATAAVVLLAINVASVWYARYPNAEMPVAALLFGAVLAFSRLVEGDRRFFGVVAGVLLGLQLFFRYDAILAIAAFLAAAVLMAAVRVRVGWAFPATLATVLGAGTWYLAGPMAAYSSGYVEFTTREGQGVLLAAPVAAVIFRWLMRREHWARAARRAVPVGLVVLLAGLAAYAYFIRQGDGVTLSVEDGMALRSFAWYVTPVGLLAAVVGLCVLAPTRFWKAPAFFMMLAAHGVFFFYKLRIVHEHFWVARRFMPFLLPAAMILVAGAVAWLLSPDRLGRWRRSAASTGWQLVSAILIVGALTPLALSYWRAAEPVRTHVEYAGLIPELESIASQVGDRDLLLVEAREADGDLHVLALPLAYIYARNVLLLDNSQPDKTQFEDFLRYASAQYERILFLGGSGSDLLSRHIRANWLHARHFEIPEYESAYNAYPTATKLKKFDVSLIELQLDGGFPSGPLDLAIGGDDDLQVLNFFAKERTGDGVAFRWTKQVSWVLLLGMEPTAREVILWMGNGGRPSTAPPAAVEVMLDGVILGTAVVGDTVQPHRFELPVALAERAAGRDVPVRLRLASAVWNPLELIGAGDSRDLGVMLTRVQVQ
jgi:4-amino-4-deoxy-L-arabinose transferase-like glycosyltransferase